MNKAQTRVACLTENCAQGGWVHPEGQQWAQQVVRDGPRRRGHARALCRPDYSSSESSGCGPRWQVSCSSSSYPWHDRSGEKWGKCLYKKLKHTVCHCNYPLPKGTSWKSPYIVLQFCIEDTIVIMGGSERMSDCKTARVYNCHLLKRHCFKVLPF